MKGRILFYKCCGLITFMFVSQAYAQSAIKSGVQGQILIDEKLKTATNWPMSVKEKKTFTSAIPASIRRQSPFGTKDNLFQLKPRLQWVLEGVSRKKSKIAKVVFENLRFDVPHILIVSSKKLKVENKQEYPITILFNKKEKKKVLAGETVELSFNILDSYLHVVEFPFVSMRVKILPNAVALEINEKGKIKDMKVEGGEYRLGAYWGAEERYAQSLLIPESKYVAIIARISENIGITVEVKEGGLHSP